MISSIKRLARYSATLIEKKINFTWELGMQHFSTNSRVCVETDVVGSLKRIAYAMRANLQVR